MDYVSTKTIESKAVPGVSFVIKKMTARRRDALRDLQEPFMERMRPIREQRQPLHDEYVAAIDQAKAAVKPERDKLVAEGLTRAEAEEKVPLGKIDFPNDRFQEWAKLTEEIRRIDTSEMTPAAVRYCLQSITGLTVDGEPATLDLILENGPDELYNEIAHEVARELGVLPEEAENLSSPSTSAAAVDGTQEPGSAALVVMPGMITAGPAGSSTGLESAIVPITSAKAG